MVDRPASVIHHLNRKQQDLSDQLVAAWTNFAWTGNPNGLGNSPWPRYKGAGGYYLSQDIPTLSTFTDYVFIAAHKCDFWNSFLIYNSRIAHKRGGGVFGRRFF